jgi:osmoprotectant transport system permease protein
MILCGLLLAVNSFAADERAIVVGSKNFTEGMVIGELIRALAASTGATVEHRRALCGTRLVFNALVSGDIDIYAEYTGTLTHEIFAQSKPASNAELQDLLAESGLVMSQALGFRDNFALGMREPVAERLNIGRISDLRSHPDLVLRFGPEFTERSDGWPGLRLHYGLPQ